MYVFASWRIIRQRYFSERIHIVRRGIERPLFIPKIECTTTALHPESTVLVGILRQLYLYSMVHEIKKDKKYRYTLFQVCTLSKLNSNT